MRVIFLSLFCLTFAAGCGVHRTVSLKSDPPGALIYLNGLEIGRTPVQRDFVWYGTYDVEVRKDGYHTLKTRSTLVAPWWQWVPIDFFAELIPVHLHDHQRLIYKLEPQPEVAADPDLMIHRAGEMQAELESSKRTRFPSTTQASTRPTTRKSRSSSRPATTQSTQPSTGPATQSSTEPATQSTTQPATQPSTQPTPAH